MKTRTLELITLACFVFLTAAIPPRAGAIPAFARAYKLSCTTCHAPFPRLKAYGLEFAANGFTIPEQENERDFVSAGDDLLKLNRTFPIAVRFDAFALAESKNDVSNDLQTPWGLKLLSGGPLAKKVGYYFYFFMNESGEVAGVEDAYIHFDNLGGQQLDLLGESQTDLTYDRGIMVLYDIASTGTGFVGQVVNGNGKGPAGEDGLYDGDKYKNFGARVTQEIGELVKLGYYYYYGQELGGADRLKNEVTYNGPDLTLGNGMLDLTFQYLVRKDTNPGFTDVFADVETKGIVAELVFSPQKDRSRQYLTLLYNQVDCDWDQHDGESFTASFTHLFARNLRGTVEYTRNLEAETDRGVIGLVSAF